MSQPSHNSELERLRSAPNNRSSHYFRNSMFLGALLLVGMEALKFLVYGACFYLLVSLLINFGSAGSVTASGDAATGMPVGEKVGIGMVGMVAVIMLLIIIFAPNDKAEE